MEILMVVLAKSYKPGGRCIAGRAVKYIKQNEVEVGNWVRPVANDGTGCGALTEEMYQYDDGTEVKILDIVNIPIIRHFPIDGQPENHVIDANIKWRKVGSLDATSICNITENVPNIWNDPNAPSNIVTAEFDQLGLISQSLCMIQPSNLTITLSNEYNEYEQRYKRKIVASFDYAGVSYDDISVTCPSVRKVLKNQYPDEGGDPITTSLKKGDNYVLCISLSPRFGIENNHYKLVATVFDFDGYLQREYSA